MRGNSQSVVIDARVLGSKEEDVMFYNKQHDAPYPPGSYLMFHFLQ